MDYNARYYSPVLGRFVSPDSIVPEPTSSGGFNRYRYVRNNPLKYIDPTGHYNVDSDTGECFGGDCDHYIGYRDFNPQTLPNRVRDIYDYGQKQIANANLNSYQKFRNAVQYAGSLYGFGEAGQFMMDITLVLYGHKPNGESPFFQTSQYNPSSEPHFLGIDAFSRGCSGNTCDTGFAEGFRDNSGNQPFHFWFYVATSYFDAPGIAWGGNFIHDGYSTRAGSILWYHPINQALRLSGQIHLDEHGTSADYALGVAGARLGRQIGWWEREIKYGLTTESIGDLVVNWLDTNIAGK